MMPYEQTVQFSQEEVLLRTRFCSGRDDLKSSPTCFALDEISPSRLSQADVNDQEDPSWTSLELDFFQYHQLPPCLWVIQRNVTSSGHSANELVPRVMALLAGNHINLPDQETCHVSLIHLFVSFQMSGLIAYKQLISIVTLFISKISFNHSRLRSSSKSILRPQLSLVLDPGIFLSSSLVFF